MNPRYLAQCFETKHVMLPTLSMDDRCDRVTTYQAPRTDDNDHLLQPNSGINSVHDIVYQYVQRGY